MKVETEYLLRRSMGRTAAPLVGLLGAPFLIGASAGLEKTLGFGVTAAGMFVSVALMIASGVWLAAGWRRRSGHVSVSAHEVSFDGRSIPRAAIAAAYFAPAVGASPASVRLIAKNKSELGWIGVRDAGAADEVLAALGMAAEKSTSRFYALATFGSAGGKSMLAVIALAVALMSFAGMFNLPVLVVAAVVALIAGSAYFLPAQIQIGADGLHYQTRVAPTFYAWSDVSGVEAYGRGIQLRTGSGEIVALPMTQRAGMYYEHEKVAQAGALARAQAALNAFQRRDVPDVTARIERRGATKDAWVARLFDREGSFREAPLRNDDLWAVVESPAASHSARAGAAAVLAREATADDRVRLRVAADACAEPRVRVVLDKAAGGVPEDELVAALDDVSDAERAAS